MQENLETGSVSNTQRPSESYDFSTTNVITGIDSQINSYDSPPAKLKSLIEEVPRNANKENRLNEENTQIRHKMESNLFIFFLIGLIGILIVAIAGMLFYQNSIAPNNTSAQGLPDPSPTPSEISSPVLSETIEPLSNENQFENNYLKISIPDGWKYTTPLDGAINLTKDNYILYINPVFKRSTSQSETRFTEITSGSPSADAVIIMQPSGPCGIFESSSININKRFDYYVNQSETSQNCNKPLNNSVWYFSYVSDGSGFFNNYKDDPNKNLLITMSYNSRDIKKLPAKGDQKLETMLNEMSDIVKSVEIKQNLLI